MMPATNAESHFIGKTELKMWLRSTKREQQSAWCMQQSMLTIKDLSKIRMKVGHKHLMALNKVLS